MDIYELAYRLQKKYRGKEDSLRELGYHDSDIKMIKESEVTSQFPVDLIYKMSNDYITIQVRTMRGDQQFNHYLEDLRQTLQNTKQTKVITTLIDRQVSVAVWLYDDFLQNQ